MAHQEPANSHEQLRPHANTPCNDNLAEEVRRRWVSIASYYVAQRKSFLAKARPDGWLDIEQDFHLIN